MENPGNEVAWVTDHWRLHTSDNQSVSDCALSP